MIFPCGMLMAPGTWPLANICGLRASIKVKPGLPLLIASCVSQQSVSNANCDWKCWRARSGLAAGTWVTAFSMTDLHEDGGSYCSAGALAGQLARLPLVDQIMPKPKSGKRNINPLVAALVYDGFCMFEFACAAEVFGLPRP